MSIAKVAVEKDHYTVTVYGPEKTVYCTSEIICRKDSSGYILYLKGAGVGAVFVDRIKGIRSGQILNFGQPPKKYIHAVHHYRPDDILYYSEGHNVEFYRVQSITRLGVRLESVGQMYIIDDSRRKYITADRSITEPMPGFKNGVLRHVSRIGYMAETVAVGKKTLFKWDGEPVYMGHALPLI